MSDILSRTFANPIIIVHVFHNIIQILNIDIITTINQFYKIFFKNKLEIIN
jgi:hypothetical protein